MLIENIKEVENGIKNIFTVKEDYLFEIVKSNASLVIVMSFKTLKIKIDRAHGFRTKFSLEFEIVLPVTIVAPHPRVKFALNPFEATVPSALSRIYI